MSINAFLAGSTGLVGSNILTTLISHPAFEHTYAFTRRTLSASSPKLSTFPADPASVKDISTWPSLFPNPAPASSVFISGLGTTRAAAGGLDQQRKIDYELNFELAKAAKAAGIKTYVLISSGGASSSSSFAYPKMKGELEDAVKKLGFDHTVILRPGLIVGDRGESRPAEAVFRKIAGIAGALSTSLKDSWAQDADVIAKAAVSAAVQCVEGKREKGVWEIGQSEIIKLGRTEWKVAEQK
ncbi:hypothetical protein C8Q74DRAFT_1041193 [Fomes fomentarius]|nr:hypothetical protein C8Q74DRAFT_1041193 [Fomes fomentarius]